MKKKPFGKTGEELSILGFGAMRLPLLDPANPESIDMDLAVAMVRKSIDGGVNYLDTAYPYHRGGDVKSPGRSEPFLARALADGYRERVRLATKLPTWFMESEKQMHEILDSQLERMNTNRIDFYLAHNLNAAVWPRMRDIGMFNFLDKAKKDGKIGHIGFSFHDRYELFEEIVDAYDWEFGQIQYNYLDVDYQAGRKGLELMHKKGMGTVIMEPIRGGFLYNSLTESMKTRLAGLQPDWSPAEWALRWLWNQPEVDVVLSGMSAMSHVEENLAVAERSGPMAQAELDALDAVRRQFMAKIKVNCTGCGYCLPCPVGVNIPSLFGVYGELCMADDESNQNRARFMYNMYAGHSHFVAPDKCVACKQCEPKCPQGIPISEGMKEVAAAFIS